MPPAALILGWVSLASYLNPTQQGVPVLATIRRVRTPIWRMRWPATILAIVLMYYGLLGAVIAFGLQSYIGVGIQMIVAIVGLALAVYADGLERDD